MMTLTIPSVVDDDALDVRCLQLRETANTRTDTHEPADLIQSRRRRRGDRRRHLAARAAVLL